MPRRGSRSRLVSSRRAAEEGAQRNAGPDLGQIAEDLEAEGRTTEDIGPKGATGFMAAVINVLVI
ncbi:hypothetical protein HNQ53_003169 [Microbulbifer hydrolyticus]|uniref:Uncharacterized protein n=1 Tax=Microbulbifer hydrolyticus TaxID=48074 RepID=A0AA89PN31_9GAMM|nr:hypothetical protein [Microbulbifer hydrolyticus]